MKPKIYLLLILLLGSIIGTVYGQSENIQATWTATPSEATIGHVITLTLTVTHPQGYRVITPKFGATWGDFEIRSVGQPQITIGDEDTEITSLDLHVAVLNVGTFTIPDLNITVYNTDGQAITVNPIPLTINIISVLQEGDTTLRDIKGQVDLMLPEASSLMQIVLLGSLTLIGGGIFILHEFRKRRKLVVVDTRLPYEKAIDELKYIETLNLPATDEYKQHYDLISQCMRQYLQDGLNISAMERTTTELKQLLRQSELSHDVVRDILDILTVCDLIKFGSVEPEQSVAYSLISRVGYIIERTRPQRDTFLEPERSVA